MSLYQHLQAARLVSARNLDAAIASYRELHLKNDSGATDMLALSLWWRGHRDDAVALIADVAPRQASRAVSEIMCCYLQPQSQDTRDLTRVEPWVQRLATMPQSPSMSEVVASMGWLARQISPARHEASFPVRVRTGLDAFVDARRHSVLWAQMWLAAPPAQRIQLLPPTP